MTTADKYYSMAIAFEAHGNYEEALACYIKITEINPTDGDAYFNLATKLSKHQRYDEAIQCYRKAIAINPNDTDSYYNMALALTSKGELVEAIYSYKKVLEINPTDFQTYNNMGSTFMDTGDIDQAISCFKMALKINPKHVSAYNNLGISLKGKGALEEAISCYKKVLEINPDDAQAYNNMGIALKETGRIDEAISCYHKAIEHSHDFYQAYSNLGNAFKENGDEGSALSCFFKAITIRPDYGIAHYNLANLYRDQKKPEKAIECYQKAIALDPHNTEPYKGLGDLLHSQGDIEGAQLSYNKALEIKPDSGLEIKSSLLLPVICESRQSIEHYRKKLHDKLYTLKKRGITIIDPLRQIGAVPFLLSYHNLNDKDLMEKIASFYISACPDLTWTSPACVNRQRTTGKIKIGMISTNLYGHTIGQLFYGVIKHLSREKFQVKVFRFPEKPDPLSKAIDAAADEVIVLPYNLVEARENISRHFLDILFYLDIGMDPMTYFLAFSRLAPVQCKRGHPVTSGIPNIDYFLSPRDAETAESDGHYSERLIRLKTYGYYYYRPDMPKEATTRQYFSLPEDMKIYLCPQSLFKFHPDFDQVFGDILRRDTRGLLVLVEGESANWSRLLLRRFSSSFSDVVERVKFLPRMPHNEFMSLFLMADAVLDTPAFSGGKTSLDCFSFGVPIVTLPGQFMRGRLTLAQYRIMGITELIAENQQEFVEISIRLANDLVWKDQMRQKILSACHLLYEDMESVRELESFFERAVLLKSSVSP